MADPKILNLDDLSSTDRKILRLDGQEHAAVEMTVEAYIERVKRSRGMKEDAPEEDKIAQTVEFLQEVYPTITGHRFRRLTLAQLQQVVEFTIAAPQDIATAVNKSVEGVPGNA